MIKTLTVNSTVPAKIYKKNIHDLITKLRDELSFNVKSLTINFVDNENILELNRAYLKHDYTTDIITFNYSDENEIDSEIFISLDEALENSKKYKVGINSELLRLIIHGILHVKGFDDIKKSDRLIMKKKENQLVNKFENQFCDIVKL